MRAVRAVPAPFRALRRRADGGVPRPAGVAARPPAARAGDPRRHDADHPVRHDPLGRAAGQGAGDEPADAVRGVRAAGARLPGRAPRVAARLRRARARSSPPSRCCCSRSRSGSRPTTACSCSARIKELHDAGLSNEEAVALGLQRTGRIVTVRGAADGDRDRLLRHRLRSSSSSSSGSAWRWPC